MNRLPLAVVDHQFTVGGRGEMKLCDGSEFLIVHNQLRAPGSPAIGGQHQERIASQGIDRFAANPARLRVPELDLFERGVAHALRRFGPGNTAVVTR